VNVAKNINVSIKGEPLDYAINTGFRELGPMPTKDGTRLYFSRQGYAGNTGGAEDEDIWYSDFDPETQTWKEAVNPGTPLNNAGPNFITGIGTKGDTLLLANVYRKNGKMMAGASVSIKTGNLWSFPVPVKIAADYNFASRAGYDLSADRTTLIIAEEKIDSNGKLDLYVSFRDPDARDEYAGTESINLGKVINTFGDETSPWLAYDGKTLYFASDGHNGYGKMDIFVSKRLDNTWTNWSEPLNLGPGINSVYDDLSFNYNPTDRYAYYSRGFSSENTDIFRIEMTELFTDHEVVNEGHGPAEIGQTKLVSNVFDNDMSLIKKDGLSGLQMMIDYLKKNNKMIVMINTHSNVHQDRTQSITLSNERAQKIFDYLVTNGIDKKRLSFYGLGHDIVANIQKKPGTQAGKVDEVASLVEFKILNYEN
jgi:outer membrane protein OmpA-like peptidoglycan-associated protein